MDDRLRDPEPDAQLPGPIVASRLAIETATRQLLWIPDAALEREWPWIGQGEGDVRSGFYIGLQVLERASGELTDLATGRVRGSSPAAGALAAATAARWDLQGVLAAVEDSDLDADPGGGQWTIRQTLAHTVAGQRGYAWFTAWWVGQRDVSDFPPHAPDELEDALPGELADGSGSAAAIRRRLDALVDLSSEIYRDGTAEELTGRARWSGFPVNVAFRIGRWGPHIEEHTVQIEKTLVMLGRPTTEVARLVRLIHRAMGRLEAAASSLPGSLDGEAATAIEAATDEVQRIATEIAAVAQR